MGVISGINFDFPFLCREMLRAGIGIECLASWLFVDTLEALTWKITKNYMCKKGIPCDGQRSSRGLR